MKALSLRQPWAELILSSKKQIETRTWNTRFRGAFLIHASLTPDAKNMTLFGFDTLPLGKIVGRAELVSVIAYTNKETFLSESDKHCVTSVDWQKPRFGFILCNVKRITPYPAKGMLNFFEVEPHESKNTSL